MNKIGCVIILSITLLSSCSGGGGFFEYWMTKFSELFEEGHTIEKDGLEGCDTVPLPGDREQIAASFLANIDTLWVQMRDSLIKQPETHVGKYIRHEDFLYDPQCVYRGMISYRSEEEFSRPKEQQFIGDSDDAIIFLPERPSKFYHAWTNLIVYGKEKLLCWAFVIIRQDEDKGGNNRPPYYSGWSVIGKRKSTREPFKIFVRNRDHYSFGSEGMYMIELMENEALYIPGVNTCSHRDVFPVKNESKLPVVSDPEFFEKHPLFHKYNDSTYNFEWYDRGGDWRKKNKEDQAMYRYPF